MTHNSGLVSIIALAVLLSAPAIAQEQDPSKYIEALGWTSAPQSGHIDAVASIKLDGDLRFLSGNDADRFLQLNGNLPSPGISVVEDSQKGWFAVFEFDPSGYVKDDEKLDADAMLTSLKESNVENNKERTKQHLSSMTLVGWSVPPHYEPGTHQLEWGTKYTDEEGGEVINYTSRLLGRDGVMSTTLVSSPQTFDSDLAAFRSALNNFSFDPGRSYAEYREGDKLAGYGLSALIVGAGTAAAVKFGAGFFKAAGVAVVGGIAAIGAAWRALFKKKKG